MNNTRRCVITVAPLILALVVFSLSCNQMPNSAPGGAARKCIRIVTPMSHPALDETIRGFQDGLASAGFSGNKIDLAPPLNADGDFSAISSRLKTALADKPDVLFVVTTPAASQAITLSQPAGVPLVYAAVTDPVKAKIVTSMTGSETLATGVSDLYPVDKQVEFFLAIQPNMKKAGLLLNPREENSHILAEATRSELSNRNVEVVFYDVASTSDIAPTAKLALNACDCLIVNGDNLVVKNLGIVVNICRDRRKPLFVGDPDSVKKGAVATVGPSYYSIGRQAGTKAARILNGEAAGKIPSDHPSDFDYIVNTQAAAAMGAAIPETVWKSREIWISSRSTSF